MSVGGGSVELDISQRGQIRQFNVFYLLSQIGNVDIFDGRHSLRGSATHAGRFSLLHLVHLFHTLYNLVHVGLEYHAAHADLLQDELHFVEMEYEV